MRRSFYQFPRQCGHRADFGMMNNAARIMPIHGACFPRTSAQARAAARSRARSHLENRGLCVDTSLGIALISSISCDWMGHWAKGPTQRTLPKWTLRKPLRTKPGGLSAPDWPGSRHRCDQRGQNGGKSWERSLVPAPIRLLLPPLGQGFPGWLFSQPSVWAAGSEQRI